ncbi:MAG: hypothetical protein LBS99_04745, partial [Clostridiales bacterium]|nr:hypothetical protein [Clostridiales bacterium]
MQRSFMKYPLITLVMMQIKEKFNLKFLKSRKKTAFTLIFKALQFVIATVALYALFYLSVFLKVLSFNAILYAETIMLIFIALQVMAIITTTVGLVKSLYLSGDNELLLTFPVSANKVFLSKLIVFFINELRKNYLLFLPMFVAFGILDKMAFYYYLWVLAAYVLISFMPVIIGALLSIPSLFVALLLRNAKYVQL